MSDFKIDCHWTSADQDLPEVRDTTGQLAISVGGVCLTQNEDIWSRTIRDSVLVSAYPLAIWLAESWWRLQFEPFSKFGDTPSPDWRMSHELGAAGHGYVWPRIVLATDGEFMQVWAAASQDAGPQSVRYLNGLEHHACVNTDDFFRETARFIECVLSRLSACGHKGTDLFRLWRFVQDEQDDLESVRYRRIEAQLGYDADECPEPIMGRAMSLESKVGTTTIAELIPVFAGSSAQASLQEIEALAQATGPSGRPDVPQIASDILGADAPWKRGIAAARAVRKEIGNSGALLDEKQLLDLLGLSMSDLSRREPVARQHVAIAIPTAQGGFNYVFRKRHPVAKRFEYARLIGDIVSQNTRAPEWLAATDLATSRQKFQRSFAAELLCPLDALLDFLGEDFSETALEEASCQFGVSDMTVHTILTNSGHLGSRWQGSELPC